MQKFTFQQKILLLLILLGLLANIFTNNASGQTVVKNENGIYTAHGARTEKAKETDTGMKFKDAKGIMYPIFEGRNGGHYIYKTKKDGTKYKMYIKLSEK